MEMREQRQRTLGTAYTLERELGGGGMLDDGPVRNCLICLPIYLSFAFDRAGIADSTIHDMEQTLATYDPNGIADVRDPVILPLFNRRLGELYEAKGDRVKAVEHYRKVIDLWKNADPELQVVVEDLKGRVRRLTDIERIPR